MIVLKIFIWTLAHREEGVINHAPTMKTCHEHNRCLLLYALDLSLESSFLLETHAQHRLPDQAIRDL